MNVRIFISYAHENKIWLEEFVEGREGRETNPKYLLNFWQRTLDQLTRSSGNTVAFWFDRDQQSGLHAGEDWKERILEEIDQAHVAVLLITADFVVSPFIRAAACEDIPEIPVRNSGIRRIIRVFCKLTRAG